MSTPSGPPKPTWEPWSPNMYLGEEPDLPVEDVLPSARKLVGSLEEWRDAEPRALRELAQTLIGALNGHIRAVERLTARGPSDRLTCATRTLYAVLVLAQNLAVAAGADVEPAAVGRKALSGARAGGSKRRGKRSKDTGEVLRLRALGLTYQQIARKLHKTMNAVGKICRRYPDEIARLKESLSG